MAAPVLNSVAPSAGPPGTSITCLGAGFDAGAQVVCPSLVATTFVAANELRAAIPPDLSGGPGEVVIDVYVRNEDGSISARLPFTVRFPADRLQTWTTLEAVSGEVPGFRRGGLISDDTILGWMRSIAQQINAAMLARGLPLDASQWQQPAGSGQPTPEAVLELINRYGAAARLAAIVGGQFSGTHEWALVKALRSDFERELKALRSGDYDKLFRPSAATAETGEQVAGGDVETDDGTPERAFLKTQIF